MKTTEIASKLRNTNCRKCDHVAECIGTCHAHGCQILEAAADRLLAHEQERKSCFRLGQMDMRESVVIMLQESAARTFGISRATLQAAAELVAEMETSQ